MRWVTVISYYSLDTILKLTFAQMNMEQPVFTFLCWIIPFMTFLIFLQKAFNIAVLYYNDVKIERQANRRVGWYRFHDGYFHLLVRRWWRYRKTIFSYWCGSTRKCNHYDGCFTRVQNGQTRSRNLEEIWSMGALPYGTFYIKNDLLYGEEKPALGQWWQLLREAWEIQLE